MTAGSRPANPTRWGVQKEYVDATGVRRTVPAEALARLASAKETKRPFSLVLVDSEMPVMDGFETTTRIKRIAPDLPVIMFTSDARPGDVKRRQEAGLSG